MPEKRYPLKMHKAQNGVIISGDILNESHEKTALANGWTEQAPSASGIAASAQRGPTARFAPTLEDRVSVLERWMTEQKAKESAQ